MISFIQNHFIEILSIIVSLFVGLSICIVIVVKKKRHAHSGDNVAKNGSVVAENINAPIKIVNNNQRN